eukprot:GFKZ01011735.1.p1 GENE.GFKZ01011735.1~~GFKZ01011735.1.p1  ORF type:complete len:199 (+),score=22.81 GFKZ01011735.1:137-733(+)
MASQAPLDGDSVSPQTYTHLWAACNTLLSTAPSVSRHLGAALMSSVPANGMSSFARRMHCTRCGALMTHSTVRIEKGSRRCAFDNRIRRTCPACGKVNIIGGVRKGGKDREKNVTIVDELRRELHGTKGSKKKRKKSKKAGGRLNMADERSMGHGRHGKLLSSEKKRRRKSGPDREANGRSPHGERKGIAASFLFEPL